jgi:metallo-beta-lactamase family protein
MKLSFFGASHEVTGSCFLLQTFNKKILIDCGMFQGSNFNEGKNHDKFPFDPKSIDALLVTHAHLDHTGRIPKLVKDGFSGSIYMTKGTRDLAQIVWNDAQHIMKYDHHKFQEPILYDETDVEAARALCKGIDYRTKIELGDDVSAVWKDAGHIFGAAFIEVTADGKTICFSGDIGNSGVPILRETDQLGSVDVLLSEATYGGRHHETRKESLELILKLIKEGCDQGGTIMVPSFSLERTQELLYDLNQMSENNELPKLPIFLDSPMAIDALPVYKKYPEYYDREAAGLHDEHDDFFDFPQLTITRSKQESIKINNEAQPKMIIAGAGMMNGGRILHHAKRYLSEPNSTLIIVGYQAYGTLGRRLYEGASSVKIHGETVSVNATIKAIGGLSAHADQKKMLSWVRNAEKLPEQIFCVHGEPESATALAHKYRDEFGLKTYVPEYGSTVEL